MVNNDNNKLGGSSKARREQIKNGIEIVKSALPLSNDDRENLSQLQTLHCSCTYIRKVEAFKNLKVNDYYVNEHWNDAYLKQLINNQLSFCEALSGFMIVLTKEGHLIYVSENVVDYLGLKSIEVLLSCEVLTDILHPNDGMTFNEILKNTYKLGTSEFFCSWNASKIKRRVHSKADAKVIKVNGRFIANGNLFVATCIPMLRPINRDYLVSTSPTCFTSIHSLDLKFFEICEKGSNILDYSIDQINNSSLYEYLHADDLDTIKKRHKNLLNTKSQKGKVDTVQVLKSDGTYVNCLINMYYCVNSYIICKFQVLSENEKMEYDQYMSKLTDTIFLQTDGASYEEDSPLSSISASNDDSDIDSSYNEYSNSCTGRKRSRDEASFSDCESNSSDSFQTSAKKQKFAKQVPNVVKQEQIFNNNNTVNSMTSFNQQCAINQMMVPMPQYSMQPLAYMHFQHNEIIQPVQVNNFANDSMTNELNYDDLNIVLDNICNDYPLNDNFINEEAVFCGYQNEIPVSCYNSAYNTNGANFVFSNSQDTMSSDFDFDVLNEVLLNNSGYSSSPLYA